ncbi:MAG: hypothetical protein GX633_06800, partial [Clostridiales bacterium]|nr:hypothetical protein [Clostridiales bacterium]
MKEIILEAHRGVASEYPENTLPAFKAAKEQGYGMIELDTKFTLDNRCVILHNRTINATARYRDGRKIEKEIPIDSISFDQAREYDYGLWMEEEFRGTVIPTLEETLSFALENSIPLKFDSVMQSHTKKQLDIFFDTVEKMNALSFTGFTSNNAEFIKKIISRFPEAQIHYDGNTDEKSIIEV